MPPPYRAKTWVTSFGQTGTIVQSASSSWKPGLLSGVFTSLLPRQASRNTACFGAFKVEYKKGFEKSKTHFHLPMDMVNMRHAKKAQALASDRGYRKKLHGYTVLPEDMKTCWAKKAYGLQSEVSPGPLPVLPTHLLQLDTVTISE